MSDFLPECDCGRGENEPHGHLCATQLPDERARSVTTCFDRRVYSRALHGHGVSQVGRRFFVYWTDGHRCEDVARLSSEAAAWSLCDRLRDAWDRGFSRAAAKSAAREKRAREARKSNGGAA